MYDVCYLREFAYRYTRNRNLYQKQILNIYCIILGISQLLIVYQ